ncbi:MAG TPA: arginine decarboxylase, pyruvoyl-dependent [Elusimicrobia bacterium]|jgi:arginine decarboxylase|nr:arginine decarboxylase, pyruvoyl-dependent [Elusimicrobiota bacterium]
MQFVPKEVFLTKGVGRHVEKLASFEEALRDAQIAQFNLVHVSSIFPPKCRLIKPAHGLTRLKSGQILHAVIARNAVQEKHRLVTASIGLAIPKNRANHGYISEHHSWGETDSHSGEYAEDLAAMMLSTTLGIEFDANASWDKKEEVWEMSGKIVRTMNITQSAIGREGVWTTVISAAVFAR